MRRLIEGKRPPPGGVIVSNLTEFTATEQGRIQRIMQEALPGARLWGVVRAEKTWDLRPVAETKSHLADSTSVVRLFGPEVTLSLDETKRASEMLERLGKLEESGAFLLDHGMIDGQLFVRRPLFPNSLTDRLKSSEKIPFREALGISLEVIRILKVWHSAGIVHGHLNAGNICFSTPGEIAVVDGGIKLSQIRAAREIGLGAVGDVDKYLSPEAVSSGEFSIEGDIYALGHLLQDLFSRVKRRPDGDPSVDVGLEWMERDDLGIIRELTVSMYDEEPSHRAPLDYAERVLEDRSIRKYPEPQKKSSFDSFKEKVESQIPLELADEDEKVLGTPGDYPFASLLSPEETPFERDFSYAGLVEESVKEEPVVEDVGQSKRETEMKLESGGFLKYALIVLSALCLYLAYDKFFGGGQGEFVDMTDDELMAAWESSVPSEMSLVAAAAVQDPSSSTVAQQKFAERIILRSAFAGDKLSDSVNYPLIRLAFNEKWEKKLTSGDRRVALTIALGRLLGERYLPKDKVDLNNINPGVLFAIISTLGNAPGVSSVPASRLALLPPPMHFAIQELLSLNPDLKCGDPAILGLAKLWSKNSLAIDDIVSYLREDTEGRLRSLAILFSTDRIHAAQTMELLLNHPNITLDHEYIRWGIRVKLNAWSNFQPHDQLLILAGLKPSSPEAVTPTQTVQLLAHPSAKLRQFAIQGIINQIPLAHPAAVPFLNTLKERPEMLTGRQTIELAQFLEKPERATREAVQGWCETKPSMAIMAELLASTASQPAATSFDSNLSLCLQNANWEPSLEGLKKLSHHPDDLTRIFIYRKVLDLGKIDPSNALGIFTDALQREKREDLRKLLEGNIASLKPN